MNFDLINKIYSNGIDVNTYVYLKAIQENEGALLKQYFKDYHFDVQVLTLIYPGTSRLTPKALQLLEKIEKSDKIIDYQGIYKRLQDKLFQLTGKKQKVLQGKYAFFPNLSDFTEKLSKIIVKYKLTDIQKLEKCLIWHIENSHRNNWDKVVLLGYFISKDSNSQLVTTYENFDDIVKPITKVKTTSKITDI